ncbi:ATP-binding cassette domain-containing protein [Enterococcus faecium]|uniref:ABC transporter domain-containing protein n=1 Tax=Enterococcus faecium TaxID=1352 RepID=A0A242ARU1_ENTFC|nr:ABC transporter ATP-binding protein [Enterococcus faecium]OTN83644.1 hypothetical protein A5810_003125 [Enterococcus faecium]
MISLKGLKFEYPNKKILTGINFHFDEGKIYCLVGENGAGKTTLIELILGIKELQAGEITFDKKFINNNLLKNIGVVFQENYLRPRLKVKEEIDSYVDLFKVTDTWKNEIIRIFELTSLLNKIGNSLSGGERRRVLMALSFINSPKYLILDEPFTGIDTKLRNKFRGFMEDYCHNNNATIIFSEHNILECQKYNYNFIFMYEGNFILHGTKNELISMINKNYDDLQDLYLDIWKGGIFNENSSKK